jgi:hypothetical protein
MLELIYVICDKNAIELKGLSKTTLVKQIFFLKIVNVNNSNIDVNKSMTSLDTKIKQVRNQNKNKTRCHQT